MRRRAGALWLSHNSLNWTHPWEQFRSGLQEVMAWSELGVNTTYEKAVAVGMEGRRRSAEWVTAALEDQRAAPRLVVLPPGRALLLPFLEPGPFCFLLGPMLAIL